MDDWLKERANALAAASGIDSDEFDLTDADVTSLLELAKVAAHGSGARTNAPLLCYLVGLARGRGASLAELAEAIR